VRDSFLGSLPPKAASNLAACARGEFSPLVFRQTNTPVPSVPSKDRTQPAFHRAGSAAGHPFGGLVRIDARALLFAFRRFATKPGSSVRVRSPIGSRSAFAYELLLRF
jgi:hypothetical protein